MAYETINPYTEELLETFAPHTGAQLEQIIAKAEQTYKLVWSQKTLADRKVVLNTAAKLLRKRIDYFAKLVNLEMGKLFAEEKVKWS
jgi:succinate-semialdehyde dehydrogenase/glutarate-semialdehyde dehydrogenase